MMLAFHIAIRFSKLAYYDTHIVQLGSVYELVLLYNHAVSLFNDVHIKSCYVFFMLLAQCDEDLNSYCYISCECPLPGTGRCHYSVKLYCCQDIRSESPLLATLHYYLFRSYLGIFEIVVPVLSFSNNVHCALLSLSNVILCFHHRVLIK